MFSAEPFVTAAEVIVLPERVLMFIGISQLKNQLKEDTVEHILVNRVSLIHYLINIET